MQTLLTELNHIMQTASLYIPRLLLLLAIVYGVNLINWRLKNILFLFGVRPRTLIGLSGIFCSAFLHGNFNHLFFNSIPFIALSIVLLGLGWPAYVFFSLLLMVLESLFVWLFGRKNSVHIGASGVVSGYFGVVLAFAYFAPGVITLLTALIMLYYFSAILLGLLPSSAEVSWESHLAGFIAGLLLVLSLKHVLWVQHCYQTYLQYWN